MRVGVKQIMEGPLHHLGCARNMFVNGKMGQVSSYVDSRKVVRMLIWRRRMVSRSWSSSFGGLGALFIMTAIAVWIMSDNILSAQVQFSTLIQGYYLA